MKKYFFLTVLATMLLFTSLVLAQQPAPVQIKTVGEQTVLLLKGISTKETISQDMGAMFGKVSAYMGGAGIQPAGPPLSLYYSEPGLQWKIAVAVPVANETGTPEANELIQLITSIHYFYKKPLKNCSFSHLRVRIPDTIYQIRLVNYHICFQALEPLTVL